MEFGAGVKLVFLSFSSTEASAGFSDRRRGLVAFFGLDRSANDEDISTITDPVVEIGDILAAHADAAIRSGGAKAAFLGGAVDVDGASKGISVAGFGAREPENAGDDRIATGGIGFENLASRAAVFKNTADGSVTTDFFGHL